MTLTFEVNYRLTLVFCFFFYSQGVDGMEVMNARFDFRDPAKLCNVNV